jgi:hypothetical protein
MVAVVYPVEYTTLEMRVSMFRINGKKLKPSSVQSE